MNSKVIPAKYLAVVLLGIVFIILASVDAFSQTAINIGSGDTYTMSVSNEIEGIPVRAKINVVKTLRSRNFNLNNCTFAVELTLNKEIYEARCMEAVVKLFVVSRNEVVVGNARERVINVDLDFAPMTDLTAMKYGLVDLQVDNGVASFESADLSSATNFNLKVRVSAERRLLKDKVLISRELGASDYIVEKLDGGKARVSIDLNRLSNELDDSKGPTLKVELKTIKPVDLQNAINNPSLANTLSASSAIND